MTQITILYSADVHAHVDQLMRLGQLAESQRSELQTVGHHVVLVDGGDVEDRALVESDLSKGAALFRLLGAARYTASAVGNGAAFCYGPQCLGDIVRASGVPLLCANMLTRGARPLPVPGTQPTMIIPCGPVRLGLIGLTDPLNGLYERFFPVTTPDPLQTAAEQVDSLRRQGCHLVGVISHLGYDFDMRLAQALPELAFVIGGHSHTLLQHPANVGGIPVCHAGAYGQYLGRLDLIVDDYGNVAEWYGRLLPVPEDGDPHPGMLQRWHTIQDETDAILARTIGSLEAAVDLASDRACGMGQLLADALRARMNADVALCITGHLHTGLKRGPVTLQDLLHACSSPANPGATDLSGSQIVHALEYGADPGVWRQAPKSLRGTQVGIVQVSGLTYRLDLAAHTGRRVSDVKVMGQPLDPTVRYRVAATDYELLPQRGYVPGLDISTIHFDMPWVLREVLQDHLSYFNPLTPGLRPRITVVRGD